MTTQETESKRYKGMTSGARDDFQTPPAALLPLLPYLREKWLVWECAEGEGQLSRAIERHGMRCIGTDIKRDPDYDFLRMTPLPFFDCIITNPPFSIKDAFVSRCYQLGKPFALLLPITSLDSVDRRRMFAKSGLEIILPTGRYNFKTPNTTARKKSSAWFYTAWFTWGLKIGRQLTYTDHL